jgi:hypothetical protein
LKPIHHPGTSSPAPAGSCDLIAHAIAHTTLQEMGTLRRSPGPAAGERLPTSFLKHADEQSVIALAAVLRAIDGHGLAAVDFTDWGILAAPRFVGRVALAAAIQRYAVEGAWGISPHLIPHRSLHAVSGTISQALKIHGPNFGVGGGPFGAGEALLTAAALLGTTPIPGVWVVLTGWDPEPIPDREGTTSTPSVCRGLALALTPVRPNWRGLRLRVTLPRTGRIEADADARLRPFTLEGMAAVLAHADPCLEAVWRLTCGGRLHLTHVGARAALPAPHLFRQRSGVCAPRGRTGTGPGSEP